MYNYLDIYMGFKDGLAVQMVKETTVTIENNEALIETTRREVTMTEVEKYLQELKEKAENASPEDKARGKALAQRFVNSRLSYHQRPNNGK